MLEGAVGSSSNYPYISREGCETITQQWVLLLAAQHPISFEERGTDTLTFSVNFES